MNIQLFFILIGLLGLSYVWIGKKASSNLKSNDDYFLMGRGLKLIPLSLTLLATQLGGGTLLGAAEEAYSKGWIVLFYPLGVCIGLIILGLGYGKKLRSLGVSTMAEIFEKAYGSKTQRLAASALSIFALFFLLIAQAIASKKFFLSIGVDSSWIFTLFWGVLVLYTVMGGFKAVVNTDILQVLFIMVTLGVSFFLTKMPEITEIYAPVSSATLDVPWMSWLLMPLLFMLIEQDMAQRCFATKNAKSIKMGSISAGLLLFLGSSVAILYGTLARKYGIVVPEGSSALIEAIKAFTNPTITTFFMCAVILAIVSTADSLLCSISSNISCDFLSRIDTKENSKLMLSRLITLFTGVFALIGASYFTNIVGVMMLSYELSVSVLFVPTILALFSRNPSKMGSAFAMGLGGIGFILFRVYEVGIPRELLALTFSYLGYLVGEKVLIFKRA